MYALTVKVQGVTVFQSTSHDRAVALEVGRMSRLSGAFQARPARLRESLTISARA